MAGGANRHTKGIALHEHISPLQANHPAVVVVSFYKIGGTEANTSADRGNPASLLRLPIRTQTAIAKIGIDRQERSVREVRIGICKGNAPVLTGIASLGCEGVGLVNTQGGVLSSSFVGNEVGTQAEAILLIPETSTSSHVEGVGTTCTGEGKQIQDGVSGVHAGPHGQHVVLTHLGTEGSGDAFTNRELVEEAVDADRINATSASQIFLESRLQGGVAVAEDGVCEVAGAQTGAQQILAGEAGVEDQANVVVEGDFAGIVAVKAKVGVIRSVSTVSGAAKHHRGDTLQLGGSGELVSFQLAHFCLEAVNATLEDGEFLLELGHQLLELVGHFGDAVETSVEQSSCFEAGHGLGALVGAVGVTSDAAVALDQVGQSLVSPVGGLDVRELGDAGDLLLGGVLVDAVQVELCCGTGHRGQHI